MELKVRSKITASELYSFFLYHTYSSVWGFAGIIISICALAAFVQLCLNQGDLLSKICMCVAALLFLVVQPVRLYLKSMQLAENDKGYAEPIEYLFNHSGIALSQGEDKAFYAWGEVDKVISTKKIIAIYVNKKKAFKLSRNELGDDYEQLKKIVKAYAVQAVVKLK
ncbi:MAG: YcxB family protein [Lachnospiraceae bacterium]|nr:YcxB family protein [Lachnospiraceae bacterium]